MDEIVSMDKEVKKISLSISARAELDKWKEYATSVIEQCKKNENRGSKVDELISERNRIANKAVQMVFGNVHYGKSLVLGRNIYFSRKGITNKVYTRTCLVFGPSLLNVFDNKECVSIICSKYPKLKEDIQNFAKIYSVLKQVEDRRYEEFEFSLKKPITVDGDSISKLYCVDGQFSYGERRNRLISTYASWHSYLEREGVELINAVAEALPEYDKYLANMEKSILEQLKEADVLLKEYETLLKV